MIAENETEGSCHGLEDKAEFRLETDRLDFPLPPPFLSPYPPSLFLFIFWHNFRSFQSAPFSFSLWTDQLTWTRKSSR